MTNEVITIIAKPPDEGWDAFCPKCEVYSMVQTNGHRNGHDLYFCEDCGITAWIASEETIRQREREQYWLKQRYGDGAKFIRNIRDYWQRKAARS